MCLFVLGTTERACGSRCRERYSLWPIGVAQRPQDFTSSYLVDFFALRASSSTSTFPSQYRAILSVQISTSHLPSRPLSSQNHPTRLCHNASISRRSSGPSPRPQCSVTTHGTTSGPSSHASPTPAAATDVDHRTGPASVPEPRSLRPDGEHRGGRGGRFFHRPRHRQLLRWRLLPRRRRSTTTNLSRSTTGWKCLRPTHGRWSVQLAGLPATAERGALRDRRQELHRLHGSEPGQPDDLWVVFGAVEGVSTSS